MIDLVLLALLAWNTAVGYRQGLAVGVLSVLGFVGGAAIAVMAAPPVVDRYLDGVARSATVLAAVLVAAWFGQVLGGFAGMQLRGRFELSAARTLDQVLGGLASLLAACLVLWFVGASMREVAPPGLAREVAGSRVLTRIDAAVPGSLEAVAADFRQRVSTSAFPRVFEGVRPEPLTPVEPPSVAAVPRAVLTQVRRSVVKITGNAPRCGRGQEGSGAVIAPDRVITNAHVVAGVTSPEVQLAGNGRRYPATVVLFDPRVDVAVLAVPGLKAPPLAIGQDLERGADAAVAGYPGNGPYVVVPARVRSTLSATGEDIYGGAGAVRQVYSLYATVEQGNSGGPLVSTAGALVGVVFAKSLDDASTGYALTLGEVRDEITAGIRASEPVSTGGCTAG